MAGQPVLVLLGNHDLNNRNAASFSKEGYELAERISEAEFEEMYASFGFEDAYSRDKASSSCIWELVPGLRLLMIDVNVVELGSVPKETLQWRREQLKDAQEHGSRVIANFTGHLHIQHMEVQDGFYEAATSALSVSHGI